MGKRSNFERNPRDFYPTPKEAIAPLLPFLPQRSFTYAEPCAGDGALVNGLYGLTEFRAVCVNASDIEPQMPFVKQKDSLQLKEIDVIGAEYIITNPPWQRDILHPMIERFSDLRPTWLLFDADWQHTKQAKPYLDRLMMTVTVGRVKWIPDSKMTGKDNCVWYCFSKTAREFSEAPYLFGKGVGPSGSVTRFANNKYQSEANEKAVNYELAEMV